MAIIEVPCLEGLKRLYKTDPGDQKWLFLVSSDGQNRYNVMPFTSWFVSLHEPYGFSLSVYVFTGHFTHELIEKTRQFTVNVPDQNMEDEKTCCSSSSGRNRDKFGECGLTAVASTHVAPPIIKECRAHFECEMYGQYPFLMTFPGTDRESRDMTVFQGRIAAAHVNRGPG